jgi:hypothetical protein
LNGTAAAAAAAAARAARAPCSTAIASGVGWAATTTAAATADTTSGRVTRTSIAIRFGCGATCSHATAQTSRATNAPLGSADIDSTATTTSAAGGIVFGAFADSGNADCVIPAYRSTAISTAVTNPVG